MKMYILIKDSTPDNFAPLVAAHASLACYKKFAAEADMQEWLANSFKKVVCKVNEKEFANATKESKHLVLTESALDHQEVGIVFCPRAEYSKQFKYFRMWAPHT